MIKKKILIVAVIIVVLGALAAVLYLHGAGGEKTVKFEEVKENRVPVDITSDVIPEYKTMERALACVVDDDIYVLVTRGEKPSSGFAVSIDKMTIEEDDGNTNLVVYAMFDDPNKETAISQIITYPLCIVKTDLTELPDTIELRIQY